MRRPGLKSISLIAAAAYILTACTPASPEEGSKTLKVVYQKTDSFTALETMPRTKVRP